MKNVDLRVEGTRLIVEVDLTQRQGPSSSGKTIIIGTTEGNVSVPGHDSIKLGLNVYTYPSR